MTIVGGYVCGDGVLLCADTEWTWSTLKVQRAKHWASNTPQLRLAASGAGNEDSIQIVLQHFMAGLNALYDERKEILLQDIKVALETILTLFYKGVINAAPHGEERDLAVMIAAATPQEPPVLFKSNGPSVLVCGSYHYTGAGAEMATYLTSKLWRDALPREAALYMAAYVLQQVKNHVIYCGGDSIIYSLGTDGSFRHLGEGEIPDLEEHFNRVEKAVSNLRLRTADLGCSDETFQEILREFSEEITELRKIRQEKLKGELKVDELRKKWPNIHNMDR